MGKRSSEGPTRKRAASSMSICEEEQAPRLSLSQLQAITNRDEFRKRASELGIATRVNQKWRSKEDILDDYRRKLDEAEGAVDAASVTSAWPSVEELAAITPITEFRKRALQLGLLVWVPNPTGSRNMARSKPDIMADYKQKLADY